ncbi:MAG TPA: DinB family protein [Terriglobales bacterium]|nr:DinB family protein [Terriglobales bacterium]
MKAYDLCIMISASEAFNLNTIAQLLDRYHRGTQVFVDAIHSVSPAQVDAPPAPGKWSARQIACHVADSELVAGVRYRMIAAQPGSTLSAFDQEKWESQLHYPRQALPSTLGAFAAMRLYNLEMLRALPLDNWSRVAIHEERGEYTLYGLVTHNAAHVESHTAQILAIQVRFAG